MKKFLATLLAAAMLCTAIAVPAVAESTEAAQETAAVTEFPRNETLYYFSGMGVLPSSFNPFVSSGGEWPAGQMQYLLYEALFMMNMNTGELEPLLADSYEVQDDNSVIVKINEAAHFNDGSALTAADVKFSYDLGQKYSLQYSSYWDNIASVEIVDDYTIQIFQKEDAVNTPVVLDSMQMVPIVPEAIWGPIAEEAGDDVSVLRAFDNLEAPVGSGCYKVYGFNDQGIYLERDDNYWGVARFGSLPNPKYIVQPIYTSNNGVAEALVAGDLDMAQAYIAQIWNLQEQNPDIKTYIDGPPYHLAGGMVAMVYNTTLPGLDNPEVRRALAYGINYTQVAELAVSGYSALVEAMLALPDGVEDKYINRDEIAELQWSYDPDKCNELLDALGAERGDDGIRVLPDGTRMSWSIQTGYGWTDWNAAAEVISQNLAECGVEIISDMPESAVFISNRQTGSFELCLNIIGENPRPSQPWFRYKDTLYTTGVPVGEMAFSNYGRYSNAEIDALIDKIPSLTDEAELTEAHTTLTKLFLEDAAVVPIMYRPFQFYDLNESVWKNFPTQENGSTTPPMLDRGAGIRFLWEITAE